MSKIKTKPKAKRLRRGICQIEYLTIREEVKLLFERGYTIQFAYETLIEKELISMCYSSFYQYVNEENKKEILVPKQQVAPEQQPKTQEALITQTKLNNLAKKLQKEKENISLDLVAVNKDEDFFKNDKEN